MPQRMELPLSEKLKAIPGVFGVRLAEEPEYDVLAMDHHFEIRRYPELLVATTPMNPNFTSSREEAYARLESYAAGLNHTQQKISMTAPILQRYGEKVWITSPVIEGKKLRAGVMTFILPKNLDRLSAPEPDDRRIQLVVEPSKTWAVLRYAGSPRDHLMKEKVTELKSWIFKSNHYHAVSDARWAQYDHNATIPFLRRNEVQIQVEALQ